MRIVAATIGRNVKDSPMFPIQWETFKYELRQVMKEHALREAEFTQELSGKGVWNGVEEENYRFEMYFSEIETHDMERLEDTLQTLAWLYQQDGIALITGFSKVV